MSVTARRTGHTVRLAFPYDPQLVDAVKAFPYSEFHKEDREWSVAWCAQTYTVLQAWSEQGICTTPLDELLQGGGPPPPCSDGIVLPRDGGGYILWPAWRDRKATTRARNLPGSTRMGKSNKYSLSPAAAAPLHQLISEGVYRDPQGALHTGGDAAVAFDVKSGAMVSSGDPRVSVSLDRFWPEKDVVGAARDHGVDVRFVDEFSEEVYNGELARRGEGIVPEGLNAELFDYQRTAVAQFRERGGLGVFLAPGLGKTMIGIAGGLQLMADGAVERVVISPPAAVRNQWRAEILKYTNSAESDVVVVFGTPKQREKRWAEAADAKWVIVHHDILSRDFNSAAPIVKDQCFVLDEAHKGVGGASQGTTTKRGTAMRKLARSAARRLALTGTPVPNSVVEWYRLLNWFVIPDMLGTEMSFKERHQFPNSGSYFRGKERVAITYYTGARNLEELRDLSAPHFVRWTKEQVAQHLPPLEVQHVRLTPTAEYREALIAAHSKAQSEIAGNAFDYLPEDEDASELTAVGVLRALCSSPRLVHKSSSEAASAVVAAGLVPDEDGPKVGELRAVALHMQAHGERAVVFTYSRTMLEILEERFEEDGVRFVSFHGKSTQKQRDAAVEAFTTPGDPIEGTLENDGPTVFLATDAAAEGLNLGAECGTVINFDLPWTPGRLEQRSNRVHRVNGTRDSYQVLNLTVAGTLEEGILRMVEGKAHIADVLFGERRSHELTGRGVPNLRDDLTAVLNQGPSVYPH